jgi:hypothetical protein
VVVKKKTPAKKPEAKFVYVPANIKRHVPDSERVWNWKPFQVPYPEPRKGIKSCCEACRRAGLMDALWTCIHCGCRSCIHTFTRGSTVDTRRVDGTGECHRCRIDRKKAFNKHFRIDQPAAEPAPAPEDPTIEDN